AFGPVEHMTQVTEEPDERQSAERANDVGRQDRPAVVGVVVTDLPGPGVDVRRRWQHEVADEHEHGEGHACGGAVPFPVVFIHRVSIPFPPLTALAWFHPEASLTMADCSRLA